MISAFSRHQKNFSLAAQCNGDCHCSSEWNPVCDPATGQTYYSACYAGCALKKKDDNEHDLWEECACAAFDHSIHANSTSDPTARLESGFCTKECGWPMWTFLALLFFSVVASFASSIPLQQVSSLLNLLLNFSSRSCSASCPSSNARWRSG